MQVACPRCTTAVEWNEQSIYRPFCSQRCKDHDLGAWAKEEYVIPGAPQEENPMPDDRQ
ncbi:MAG: DNA gyrase inhibitor YacG [Burkholderiales bacterium]|nr:DNA gyrase inhibitor YacG [Burkholderiales bacterium]